MRPELPGKAEMYFPENDTYLRLFFMDYSDKKPPAVLFNFDEQVRKKKPKKIFQLDEFYTGQP